jgi:hypothetical protein
MGRPNYCTGFWLKTRHNCVEGTRDITYGKAKNVGDAGVLKEGTGFLTQGDKRITGKGLFFEYAGKNAKNVRWLQVF